MQERLVKVESTVQSSRIALLTEKSRHLSTGRELTPCDPLRCSASIGIA